MPLFLILPDDLLALMLRVTTEPATVVAMLLALLRTCSAARQRISGNQTLWAAMPTAPNWGNGIQWHNVDLVITAAFGHHGEVRRLSQHVWSRLRSGAARAAAAAAAPCQSEVCMVITYSGSFVVRPLSSLQTLEVGGRGWFAVEADSLGRQSWELSAALEAHHHLDWFEAPEEWCDYGVGTIVREPLANERFGISLWAPVWGVSTVLLHPADEAELTASLPEPNQFFDHGNLARALRDAEASGQLPCSRSAEEQVAAHTNLGELWVTEACDDHATAPLAIFQRRAPECPGPAAYLGSAPAPAPPTGPAPPLLVSFEVGAAHTTRRGGARLRAALEAMVWS